jgi:hypothetical protein
MGVVAVGTEMICGLASPHKGSRSLSVNAGLPVFINIAMAFSAEPVAFVKTDELPVVKPQFIPISGIMTIETPSHGFGMMQLGLGMFFFQFPLLSIHFHGGMATAAGIDPLCEWRRGNRKLLTCLHGRRQKIDPQKKYEDGQLTYFRHFFKRYNWEIATRYIFFLTPPVTKSNRL